MCTRASTGPWLTIDWSETSLIGMRSIGAYEAKTHLPRLLDEVAKGERITITKHGLPVAILIPPGSAGTTDVEATMARFRDLRRGNRLNGLSIRELIDEGRR
jgi:prevent-host-death family protein